MNKGIICLGTLLLVSGLLRAESRFLTDGIAVVVNGEIITFQEINWIDYAQEADYRKQYQGDELREKLKDLKLKTANDLIDQKLIVQEFYREGNWLSESYIDHRFRDAIKEQYQGDESRLARELAPWGRTVDDYKTQMIEMDIITFMTKKYVTDKITATVPEEIDKERETIRKSWLDSLRKSSSIVMTW